MNIFLTIGFLVMLTAFILTVVFVLFDINIPDIVYSIILIIGVIAAVFTLGFLICSALIGINVF